MKKPKTTLKLIWRPPCWFCRTIGRILHIKPPWVIWKVGRFVCWRPMGGLGLFSVLWLIFVFLKHSSFPFLRKLVPKKLNNSRVSTYIDIYTYIQIWDPCWWYFSCFTQELVEMIKVQRFLRQNGCWIIYKKFDVVMIAWNVLICCIKDSMVSYSCNFFGNLTVPMQFYWLPRVLIILFLCTWKS